jgi:hypothetical protein
MNSMLALIVAYKERVGDKTSQLKLLSESTGGTSLISLGSSTHHSIAGSNSNF